MIPVHTDEMLMTASADGDAQALTEVWNRHKDRLKRMVRVRMDPRLLGRVDASDVMQEAFMTVHRQLQNFPQGQKMPVFLWLRRLLGQTLVDLHRHHLGARKRTVGRELLLFHGMPHATSAVLANQLMGKITTASRAAARSEMKLQVQQALNTMNPLDREVLALRHFEGLSNAETAGLLEISENAGSNRYVRALRRLKELMAAAVSGQ